MTTESGELNPEQNAPINGNANSSEDKSLWEYFVSCLTEKYFRFKGRARRKEYWSFVLFNVLINFVLSFIANFLAETGGNITGIMILSWLVTLALFIPGYAVLFRRLHDVNFSGWWATAPMFGIFVAAFIFGYTDAMQHHQGITADNPIMQMIAVGLTVISVIMLLVVFVLIFFKSDMKENKYGPVPEGVK